MDDVVLGQYTADPDAANPEARLGYLDDPTVPAGYNCPTYASALLKINNERWVCREEQLYLVDFYQVIFLFGGFFIKFCSYLGDFYQVITIWWILIQFYRVSKKNW